MTASVQDRTAEFRAVLAQAQKKQRQQGTSHSTSIPRNDRYAAQKQPLIVHGDQTNGTPRERKVARSEFARKAADIGRGITKTMDKLERLAQCRSCLAMPDLLQPMVFADHLHKWPVVAASSMTHRSKSQNLRQLFGMT
jgi:Syntaxin-5 N-terminal, Sly1p-binding domain